MDPIRISDDEALRRALVHRRSCRCGCAGCDEYYSVDMLGLRNIATPLEYEDLCEVRKLSPCQGFIRFVNTLRKYQIPVPVVVMPPSSESDRPQDERVLERALYVRVPCSCGCRNDEDEDYWTVELGGLRAVVPRLQYQQLSIAREIAQCRNYICYKAALVAHGLREE